jgi:hypothetical protein
MGAPAGIFIQTRWPGIELPDQPLAALDRFGRSAAKYAQPAGGCTYCEPETTRGLC